MLCSSVGRYGNLLDQRRVGVQRRSDRRQRGLGQQVLLHGVGLGELHEVQRGRLVLASTCSSPRCGRRGWTRRGRSGPGSGAMPNLPLTTELDAVLRIASAYGQLRMNTSLPAWNAFRLCVSWKPMASFGM